MKKSIPTGIVAGVLAGGFWALGENYYSSLIKAKRVPENTLLGAPSYKDQTITAWDGITLFGRFMTDKSHRWVIGVHGYRETGVSMLPYALHYRKLGWNVLLPDLRGHGKSEGDCYGMGWLDRLDLIDWITWILGKDPEAEIVLHGAGLGASAALMASGEDLPANVKAIVSDSAVSSMKKAMRHTFENDPKFTTPAAISISALDMVANRKVGYKPSEISPADCVAKGHTPVLYLQGSADKEIPSNMADELYCSTTAPAERVYILGAGHAAAVESHADRYWEVVDQFLNKHLS